MLGRDLSDACQKAGVETAGYDLPELDITREPASWPALPPADWVVNCAAYTDVDRSESDRDKAFAVNGEAPVRVARWCRDKKIPLVHISTDYVFDGRQARPYREDDAPNPLGVYGASKLAGEQAIRESGADHVIVRTQALFGKHGKNFVDTIRSLLLKGAPLKVVNDQFTCPTWTVHLADGILRLMKSDHRGIVHCSSSGSCSWHECAAAIAKYVRPQAAVEPVTTAQYVRPAQRPAMAVLDKGLYERWTSHRMPAWQDGLAQYLRGQNS